MLLHRQMKILKRADFQIYLKNGARVGHGLIQKQREHVIALIQSPISCQVITDLFSLTYAASSEWISHDVGSITLNPANSGPIKIDKHEHILLC